VAGPPLLNGRCTSLLSAHRLRNDLYCVEWDVKLYYTIPFKCYCNANAHFFIDPVCNIVNVVPTTVVNALVYCFIIETGCCSSKQVL